MIVACLSIAILNMTPYPIDAADFKVFNRAQHVCKTGEYKGCVKKFMKRGKRDYFISCGEKEQYDKKQFDKQRLDAILFELRHLSVEDTKKALKKIGINY